jgi:iron complex outermembrane receptor protein
MKMKYLCFLFAIILITQNLVSPVSSQEDKEITLEEIRVVATPIIEGNWVNEYGSRITTVSEKQLEDLNAMDFQSSLRRVPGVTISRYNLVGSYGGAQGGAIFIRGMGAERPGAEISTLIDGRPSFVGVWTHPLMDMLSVNNLDHIDVYKGAQPVLFGNMAYGAVNLVTKRMKEDGFITKLRTGYGTYKTFDEWIEHGGKKGGFDYYLTGNYKKSEGHRRDADGQVQNYFGRMGYQFLDNWDLSFTTSRTSSWADDPGLIGAPRLPVTPRFGLRDQTFDLTLSNKYKIAEGFIKLYYDDGQIRWKDQWDGIGPFDSNTDWNNYGIRIQERLIPWNSGEIIVGYDYDVYGGKFKEVRFNRPTPPSIRIREIDNTHFYNSAPYLAIKHTFGQKLQIIPSFGLRYNISKYFGNDIGPQAGLVLKYKDTEFYAQYAHGFNLPGVYMVYYYTQVWNKGDVWKDLKPEKIDHFEVGILQKITRWLKADAALFYDAGEDRLIFRSPPPRFENLEVYRIRGVEATATLTPFSNLDFFIGGTYLSPSPYNLPYAPRKTLSAGISYCLWEKFFINLDTQYVDHRFVSNPRYPTAIPGKVGSYYLINGKIAYRYKPPSGKWEGEVFIAGENLTDVNYEFLKGYPMPGATAMIGGGIKFFNK